MSTQIVDDETNEKEGKGGGFHTPLRKHLWPALEGKFAGWQGSQKGSRRGGIVEGGGKGKGNSIT